MLGRGLFLSLTFHRDDSVCSNESFAPKSLACERGFHVTANYISVLWVKAQDVVYIAVTINVLCVATTMNLRRSFRTEKNRFPVNLRRVERLIGLGTRGIIESNARKILQAFIKKFLAN